MKLRNTWRALCAVCLSGLPIFGWAAAEPFKPHYEQNPKWIVADDPGVDMGDGSVVYLSVDILRYWPATGKTHEQPLPAAFSQLSKISAGLLLIGSGPYHLRPDLDIGANKVMLLKPDGSSLIAQLGVQRMRAKSVVVDDESVLLVGGTTRYEEEHGSVKDVVRTTAAELIRYRAGMLTVTRVADLPGEPRHSFEMVRLNDGRVMVMGGESGWYNACHNCVADTWLFDPKTEQWQAGPPMQVARAAFSATVLTDGRVLVAGGWSPRSQDAEDRVEVFNPRSNRWEDFSNLPAPISGHRATWLAGEKGKMLLFGGGTNPQIQMLDVAQQRWSTVGEMRWYRIGAELLSYRDAEGKPWALLFGGIYFPRGQNAREDYDVERVPLRTTQIAWKTPGDYPLQRSEVAIAVGADGRTLLAGGWTDGDPSGVSTASVDMLARDQSVPIAMAALNHARTDAQAFWLPQGRAVVVGGRTSGYGNYDDTRTHPIEWYDPQPARWFEVLDARDGKPMACLPATTYGQYADGALLEVTGIEAHRLVIDAGKGRREPLPTLNSSHEEAYVVRALNDGRLIVAGGTLQADLIAVVDETQTKLPAAETAADPTSDLRPRNDAYVYEGIGPATPARQHEIFDPLQRRWRLSTASRVAGEHAVILDDGRVVKVGELEPGDLVNDEWIPGKPLIEISSADGDRWESLPIPNDLYFDVDETRPIAQSGELFLRGRGREQGGPQTLWWFDAGNSTWVTLTSWESNSAYAGKLLTVPVPNGKRLVWGWPQ